MKRSIAVILLFLAGSCAAVAQTGKKNDSDKKYQDAVNAFKDGRFEQAMPLFSELAKDYSNQERSAYAHYFYASAADKLEKTQQGLQMLQQLLSRYPNWTNKDEAYYLAGIFSFKQKNYQRGLEYLQRITTSSMQKDINGLKQHYLSEISTVASLKALQKQFPNDRILAARLVQAIQAEKPNKADTELATHLIQRFELAGNVKENRKSSDQRPAEKKEKDYFDVAVLLPFRIDEFESNQKARGNQFVYDYYQGMQLAQKKLRNEKIDIRLYAYDIGSNELPLKNLMHNPGFRESDLLVGPLYVGTSELAADFSNDLNVPVVNPLSTDSKLLTKKYPQYFLAHPTLEFQVKQIARVAESFDGDMAVVIYYGESSKDSAMAELYAREITSRKGNVLDKIRIGATETEISGKVYKSDLKKPNHLVLFSTDARTGPALLNVLRDPRDSTPFLGTAVSFDFQNVRFGSFMREIYLVDTDYVNNEKLQIKRFQKDYYDSTSSLPTVYSYQGYDQMLFFGRMLGKYKRNLKDGISQKSFIGDSDYLLSGFDYRNARENQILDIRRYKDGEWAAVNL